jgi:hypothetical protein
MALLLRAILWERKFAHVLDGDGMRRAWLRGRDDVAKRYFRADVAPRAGGSDHRRGLGRPRRDRGRHPRAQRAPVTGCYVRCAMRSHQSDRWSRAKSSWPADSRVWAPNHGAHRQAQVMAGDVDQRENTHADGSCLQRLRTAGAIRTLNGTLMCFEAESRSRERFSKLRSRPQIGKALI